MSSEESNKTWTNLPSQDSPYNEKMGQEMTDLYEEILKSQEADLSASLWDLWEEGKKVNPYELIDESN